MLAEIDTGGPKVLHCAERADCPISRAPPKSSSFLSTPAYRGSSPTRQPGHRQVRHHRCCSTRDTTLFGSSAKPWIIPGNDEQDEFFRDERSATVATTPSNDLKGLGALRDRRNRKRANVPRRRSHRRTCACNEMEVQFGDASSPDRRDVPNVDEIVREEVTPIDDTRQRLSHSTVTSTCHLVRLVRENRLDVIGESSSVFVIRLFGGCGGCGCIELERKPVCPILDKLPAATSSQRNRPSVGIEPFARSPFPQRDDDETREYCVECAWQCKSECVCEYPSDELRSARSSGVKVTRERRKRYGRVQDKGRSYLQLALLLFLVAFGRNTFFKSNSGGFGRRSGTGVGIGALTIGTIVGAVRAVPVDLDASVRFERSANLSHITGSTRIIMLYINNRYLQVLPDSTVNGTNDDKSEYTMFQRTSVKQGHVRLKGVATCLYICMDACGLLYGSLEPTEECVFFEDLKKNHYNYYNSVRWSNGSKFLYLGLNHSGQPRRVLVQGHNLGKLSTNAGVLTPLVTPDRIEALQDRLHGARHNLRHHHNSHRHRNMQETVCPDLPPQRKDIRDISRCQRRKRKKNQKKRCVKGEKSDSRCNTVETKGGDAKNISKSPPQLKRSCKEAANEKLCRKQALEAPVRKRKLRTELVKSNVTSKEKLQHNRSKDVRATKITDVAKKQNSGRPLNDSSMKRAHGPNGGKRERPLSRQKPSSETRKKFPIRITRTTVATNPTTSRVNSPSTWYPGAATTPSTESIAAAEVSSWRRTKTAASPKNAVTSAELKPSDTQSTRSGKALEAVGVLPDVGYAVETSTETHDRFTSFNDSSAEISEEANSDEFTMEDDTATFSADYSTLMRTMDTTSPERTENYKFTTTPWSVWKRQPGQPINLRRKC